MFYYITTPIYYVNDRPHLGHFYSNVAVDMLARFYRMCGYHVKFLTGTDEHGAKVERSARDNQTTPQDYVDKVSQYFRQMNTVGEISCDDFVRTTQERHKKAAQAFWQELYNRGQIYSGNYEGWYSVRDEAFFDESDLTKAPDGSFIAPTGASVEWVQEPCYFFRLSHWKDALIEYYKKHPEAIAPKSRYNETMQFLEGGLKDLAISRSKVAWGIPVPQEQHTMYVWIDALTNYLTGLGYPNREQKDFENYWHSVIHVIGKDILRFHTIYWPAFLMATGFSPPRRIFAHGWWTRDGAKMSKSLNNGLDPQDLVERFGADQLRYFLMRQVRFGQDGDFSEAMLIQRCDQELADGLGNLAHRVLSFVTQRLPRNALSTMDSPDSWDHSARELFLWASMQKPILKEYMDQQDTFSYLETLYKGIQKGNQFMDTLKPWELLKRAKTGDEHALQLMHQGLAALIYFLRDMGVLLWPIIPHGSTCLLNQIGITLESKDVPSINLLAQVFPLDHLDAPTPLFRKLNESTAHSSQEGNQR